MDHDYFVVEDKDSNELGCIAIEGSITKDETWTTGSMFSGDGISVDVFEFMADHTKVEWGLSMSGNSCGMLTTSESSIMVDHRAQKGYDTFYHSHPGWGDSDKPSEEDINSAKEMKKLGYTDFIIYVPKRGKYYAYDENSK